MKTQDLMLGGLVQLADDYYDIPKGTIFKVVEIYVDTIFAQDIEGTYEGLELPEYKLEPIPITPKILEKNGFTEYGESWYLPHTDGNKDQKVLIGFYMFNTVINVKKGNIIFFKSVPCTYRNNGGIYIHELQHVFRLCGIEKEIKL